jgi:multiple antibiotic resistance protein
MASLPFEIGFLLSTFVAVFVIVDPFAVIPIYIGITERFTDHERHTVCSKATLIASCILIAFALIGTGIFKMFGITLYAFQIAGGILLLLLGIAQLNADRRRVKTEEESESFERDDVSVFPLATPLLAGPGSISTVVLYASQAQGALQVSLLVVAIALALALSYALLRFAPRLLNFLGRTGLNLLTRIMGIMLVAIAIQFVINGLKTAFNLP